MLFIYLLTRVTVVSILLEISRFIVTQLEQNCRHYKLACFVSLLLRTLVRLICSYFGLLWKNLPIWFVTLFSKHHPVSFLTWKISLVILQIRKTTEKRNNNKTDMSQREEPILNTYLRCPFGARNQYRLFLSLFLSLLFFSSVFSF